MDRASLKSSAFSNVSSVCSADSRGFLSEILGIDYAFRPLQYEHDGSGADCSKLAVAADVVLCRVAGLVDRDAVVSVRWNFLIFIFIYFSSAKMILPLQIVFHFSEYLVMSGR